MATDDEPETEKRDESPEISKEDERAREKEREDYQRGSKDEKPSPAEWLAGE